MFNFNWNKYLIAIIPVVFVLLWSTGFIAARFSTPYAEPLTFLSIRMAIAAFVLIPIVFIFKQKFPRKISEIAHSIVVGFLLHAVYLGGVFYVTRNQFPIAYTSLIVGLQPLLASLFAMLALSERINRIQWLGLLLGFGGLMVVLSPTLGEHSYLQWQHIIICFSSLLAITVATTYQKRYCAKIDLIAGATIQYIGAFVFVFLASLWLEEGIIVWNTHTIFSMVWLVLVLSIGAVLILLYMVHKKAAASVTSLFYLTPAVVAFEVYLLFGEAIQPTAIGGFVLSLFGVYLIAKKKGVSKVQ